MYIQIRIERLNECDRCLFDFEVKSIIRECNQLFCCDEIWRVKLVQKKFQFDMRIILIGWKIWIIYKLNECAWACVYVTLTHMYMENE